jgi:hypothetical protein
MNRRTRYLVLIASAVAAAIIVPVALAGNAMSLHGVAGFGASTQTTTPGSFAAPTKEGCADFGLTWNYNLGCVSASSAKFQSSAAGGFQWGGAGIGAAGTLGLVLLVAGLGVGMRRCASLRP